MNVDPGGLPRPACAVLARALDRWAREQDDVLASLGHLPRLDRYAPAAAVGLFVDDRRAPWIATASELRFSLARVYSVTPAGVRLVGQLQITAVISTAGGAVAAEDPERALATVGATVRVRYYVHELQAPGTREVEALEFAGTVEAQHAEYARRSAPRDGNDPAYA